MKPGRLSDEMGVIYTALAERRTAEVLPLLAEEFEVWQSEVLPWGGRYRGKIEFKRYIATLLSYVDPQIRITHVVEDATHTVVSGRSAGRVWDTGTSFDVPIVHIWEMRDGRFRRLEAHTDTARMLHALMSEVSSGSSPGLQQQTPAVGA